MKIKLIVFSVLFIGLFGTTTFAAENKTPDLQNVTIANENVLAETNEIEDESLDLQTSLMTASYDSTYVILSQFIYGGVLIGGMEFNLHYSYEEGTWVKFYWIETSPVYFMDGYEFSVHLACFPGDAYFTCVLHVYDCNTGLTDIYVVDIWGDNYGTITQNVNYLYSFY